MKRATLILTATLISLSVFAQEIPVSIASSNIVWLSAYDLNLADGGNVTLWEDKSPLDHDAYQYTNNRKGTFLDGGEGSINDQPSVYFDGVRDYLEIANSSEINSDGPYSAKTFVVVFRTSDDINSAQIIYEEGAHVRGMNLYLYDGKLYAGIYNLQNDNGDGYFDFVGISAEIEVNTNYFAKVVFDADSDSFTLNLNGNHIGTENNVGLLYRHTGNISIGGTAEKTVMAHGTKQNVFFRGSIGEFAFFNSALSDEDLDLLADAIGPRWGFDHTGVLPVEMLEYSASVENNSTIIRWATASELNNEFFTIERSEDLENWVEIGTVYGAGNSNTRMDYEYVDYTPLNGTVYYRISQTDFDGTTEIFNPFSVNAENTNSGLVIENSYSNGNGMRVEFTSESSDPVNIKIFSMSGAVLAETTVNPTVGFNSVSLDVNASGIGIVKLGQRGEFLSEKTLLN